MVERIWLMSAYATSLIIIVLGIRHLLKKYSKIYCYALWILVMIRLVCPIFITSNIKMHSYVQNTVTKVSVNRENSMKNVKEENGQVLSEAVVHTDEERLTGTPFIDKMKIVWLLGTLGIGGYFLLQYWGMKRKLQTAIREKDNIWLSDRICSPFVFGLVHPKIYLPYGMQEKERDYIVQHEETHIRHKDAWIRMLGTLAVCLHWWNPVVWYGMHIVNQDMEMFCDETVLQTATNTERKEYAKILLLHSIKSSRMNLAMAFGETNTEKRIRHISKRKKKNYSIKVVTMIATVILLIFFGTLPKETVEAVKHEARLLERPIEFAGGDISFEKIVDCSAEEARTYLNDFYMAVLKDQKEEVAGLFPYPRKLQMDDQIIDIKDADEFIKYYDVIITDNFKMKLKDWMENEINYTYIGMYLNDGEIWMILGEDGWFINSIENGEGKNICYDVPLS
ncbi:MAG: M56 family metallopeptidase [bacterium]|nr:M56 family metallopeptidase [bacterium]